MQAKTVLPVLPMLKLLVPTGLSGQSCKTPMLCLRTQMLRGQVHVRHILVSLSGPKVVRQHHQCVWSNLNRPALSERNPCVCVYVCVCVWVVIILNCIWKIKPLSDSATCANVGQTVDTLKLGSVEEHGNLWNC